MLFLAEDPFLAWTLRESVASVDSDAGLTGAEMTGFGVGSQTGRVTGRGGGAGWDGGCAERKLVGAKKSTDCDCGNEGVEESAWNERDLNVCSSHSSALEGPGGATWVGGGCRIECVGVLWHVGLKIPFQDGDSLPFSLLPSAM